MVDANAASSAASRFRLIFRQQGALPVTFTSIKAAQAGSNIAVEWKVANQINIARYEVEKSVTGSNFAKVGTQAASAVNSGTVTYTWLDENATTGVNFYRIKSVDNNGRVAYTNIVKVTIGGKPAITVSPNPVQGNYVNLQFTNRQAGKYSIRLINIAGQVLYSRTVIHAGGSASQSFNLPSAITRGVYNLEIVAPDKTKQVEKLIINTVN